MTTGRSSLSALAIALVATTSCIPRHPSATARPVVTDAPWESLTVRSEASGQEHRYLRLAGPDAAAPRLLLLHGGFVDNRMWRNMDGLARRFEVFALEMPSDSPLYRGRIEDYGDLARDFLAALGVSDLYVAGQSAGGWAAVDLVSRHRDLNVHALFLISTGMFAVSEEEVERRTEMAERALSMEPERLRATVEYAFGRTELEPAPGDLQIMDIFYVRPYSYYRQLFGATLEQGARRQATDQIACPVLVIHGTDDETIPFESAQATPSFFSDATLVPLEGRDHAMTFTHGPEVVAAMLEFVDERGLIPPRTTTPTVEETQRTGGQMALQSGSPSTETTHTTSPGR